MAANANPVSGLEFALRIHQRFNLNPAVGRGRGADEAGLWLGASAPRTACPGGASNNARGLKRQTCGRAALSPMR